VDRLREEHGPEVLIVGPAKCTGWREQQTVGILRNQFVRRLQEHDQFGRLRFVYPVLHGVTPCPVFIHSKICIVDDTFARIGSANLTNRFLGLDTECDLAIESGGNPRIEAAIARFRNRLLSEHLGVLPERLEEAVADQGSLPTAVDTLRGSGRGFARVEAQRLPEANHLAAGAAVFDPNGPIDPTALITKALPTEAVRHSPWPMTNRRCTRPPRSPGGPLALDAAL
jgi:phospholipase D1/2